MRRLQEPSSLPEVSTVLEDLSDTVARVEDDLLASLVVMGESDPQRAVDGWVDQVVDLLRAVDEVASQHRATLALAHSRAGARNAPAHGGPAREDATTDTARTSVDALRTGLP